MKQWEQEALRLKYEGKTYREIATVLEKTLRIKVSENTVRNYFTIDGKWYLEYVRYEAMQNRWTEEHSRQEYKNLARYTSKIQHQLLKEAMKVKDFRLAFDILKDINDRAGLVVVRKSEVNIDEKKKAKIETYEEFVELLRSEGIDPKTGLRVSETEVGSN